MRHCHPLLTRLPAVLPAVCTSSCALARHHTLFRRCSRQSGWGDLFKDKYEEVLDESTGEIIMVEKNAKKYKLDAAGNIVTANRT